MGYLSIIAQRKSIILFTLSDYNAFFSMPLSDLSKLSELSFEWFEEYLPNSPYSPYEITLLEDCSVRDRTSAKDFI